MDIGDCMKFILIAGMPGAGKSIAVAIAREKFNLPVYVMGDVVREEALNMYGTISPETMLKTAEALRREHGPDYVAVKTYERISGEHEVVVIDGVRSLEEVEFFKRKGEVVIVAIHASPKTRFKRLLARGRAGDPKTWEEFVNRDRVELGLGLGNVIALADYVVVNESAVEEAYEELCRVFEQVVGENKC